MIAHLPNRPRFISRVNLFFIAVGLLGLLHSGCAPKDTTPPSSPPQALNLNTFTIQWDSLVGTENGKITRVYARGNFVFAYTDKAVVFILDRNDGRLIAMNKITPAARPGARLHPPVVTKNMIIFPTSASLEVYNLDGSFNRSKILHHSVRSEAVGAGQYLYYGADYTNGGRLVQVELNSILDHRQELMFPHASVSSRPIVIGDTVFAAAENGDVVALNVDTFHAVWPNDIFHTFGAIVANLGYDDNNLYIASTDQKLVAIATKTAKVRWQYTASVPLRDTPAVTKDTIFQYEEGQGLLAISKETGDYNRHPNWRAPDVKQYLGIDDHYVYGRRTDNAIVAMARNSGQIIFTSARPDYTAFAPNYEGDLIYAATSHGRVLAVKPVLTPGGMGETVMAPVTPQEIASAN